MQGNREKTLTCFLLNFEFQSEKNMTLVLFEFQDDLMIDTFLIKLTQFKKNWINWYFFIPLVKLKLNSTLKTRKVHAFSRYFHVCIWRSQLTLLSADDHILNSKIYMLIYIYLSSFIKALKCMKAHM